MENQDLSTILATLAQYNSANTVPTVPNTPESRPETSPVASYDPEKGFAVISDKPQDPRPRPQSRSAAVASPKPPTIDPATITVWQDGLRCVTKIAAQNAHFADNIKRMMKDQRANEMRWYTERQNLKQTQVNRSTSAAKAQSIMKSLTTSFYGTPPQIDGPEVDKEKELAELDEKIYVAQVAMNQAMTVEMKALGVPFFGTESNLIVPNDYDLSENPLPANHPKWSPLVTESQLKDLRLKMINHLEDLYRD